MGDTRSGLSGLSGPDGPNAAFRWRAAEAIGHRHNASQIRRDLWWWQAQELQTQLAEAMAQERVFDLTLQAEDSAG